MTTVLLLTIVFSVALAAGVQKRDFLEAHNYFRAKENAKDMQELTWSRSLQKKAADWADKCLWEHSPKSDRKFKSASTAGENLFMSTAKDLNVTKAVNMWYNEKKYYSYKHNSCESGKKCGHYKQVVWSKSYKLGCAAKRCQPLYEGKTVVMNPKAWYIVCQYGPGVLKGVKPYTKGIRCSRCPNDTTCDSRKLCVISDKRRELQLLLEAFNKDFEENITEE
ncbi:uncharacterized protein LOC132554261 [Ylistrum balloti]|uniref:uncharacterized protein LOC132554261 n=1 Tax=Ylistrum balloti TaxID=509963 RepID=UPI002905C4A2|nr:uncharacterized protein LOC132554261 [Ylistrum balloti]